MKILKIEFQNINSLKGHHEIDFTASPFTAGSLFAITGPTGSGKSTILDVISLALFNQVPRLGKITKNEILSKGAILTRNQKEAFAKITYESKSGCFSSLWSISTNRNDNLRDYEMQIFDLASEKALDLKKSDVPAKNEELIGLNYDQFIKSVLLAQGEFAQFLKAKKDERGELLEKITGTGIYRQIGVKAFQKFKEVNSEIEEERKEADLIRKDLLEDEELKAHSAALSEKEKKCAPLEKEVKQLEQNLELKKNIAEQLQQVETHRIKKEAAEAELKKFEAAFGIRLQKHEKISRYAEELRTWKRLRESCAELNTEVKSGSKKAGKNSEDLTDCLQKIRNFTGSTADADGIEQALQDFSERIRQLQKSRDEKLSRYHNLQEKFTSETRHVGFSLNGDLQKSRQKLIELRDSVEKKLLTAKEVLQEVDLSNCEEEKLRLKKELEKARAAKEQVTKQTNLTCEIARLHEEEAKILPQLQELPQNLEKAGNQVKILAERQEKLELKRENALLQASLKEHRANLKPGEACPLCGSLEHPLASGQPKTDDSLQAELQETTQQLEEWKNRFSSCKTSLAHYKNLLEDTQKKKLQVEKELESEKSRFRTTFGEAAAGKSEEWEDLGSGYEKQLDHLDHYQTEDRKRTAINAGLPVLEELEKIVAEGKEVKNQISSIYSGNNINRESQELQTSFTRLKEEQKAIAQLAKDLNVKLEKRSGDLKKLEEELIPLVQKEDCEDLSAALARLLPEQEHSKLRNRKEELSAETGKLKAALETLIEQLERLKKKDVEKASEEISEELRQKRENLGQLQKECEEYRRQLLNDEERRRKIEELENKLAGKKKEIRRWELLNTLIGDATGKKFNDFAQELTLSQLLQLANVRLQDLSDRYRIDKPVADEDDGLVAIDEHMGGQRRSVKTLSGGETFILSLSMALALSDLASKNVEINSLFIDEGFGTLDPETLDQTLDTLEKLQAESSKTIGIISHVDSLKERIATQIQLKRNGQGYSSLEIRA